MVLLSPLPAAGLAWEGMLPTEAGPYIVDQSFNNKNKKNAVRGPSERLTVVVFIFLILKIRVFDFFDLN